MLQWAINYFLRKQDAFNFQIKYTNTYTADINRLNKYEVKP
jgi:hypothetical protein